MHNFTPKNPVLQKYSSRGKCLNFLNGGNFDKKQVGKESKPNEQPLNEKSKKEALRNHDMEMNSQLKDKMNGIRKEVEHFNQNIDEFSQICDNELAKLYDNVEKVSKNIGNNNNNATSAKPPPTATEENNTTSPLGNLMKGANKV